MQYKQNSKQQVMNEIITSQSMIDTKTQNFPISQEHIHLLEEKFGINQGLQYEVDPNQ